MSAGAQDSFEIFLWSVQTGRLLEVFTPITLLTIDKVPPESATDPHFLNSCLNMASFITALDKAAS